MSDPTGGTGPDRDEDEPTLVDHPTSAAEIRAPWTRRRPDESEEVRHSALVGFMSVPVHRRVPIRRSTLVLVVAFLGLGTLLYFNPAQSDTTGKGAVVGGYFVPGAVAVSTTTAPPAATTVPPATTTTTRAPAVTTTTAPVVTGTAPTTTARGATTTTTSAPVGGGFGGTPGPTTTTTGAQLGGTGSTGPTTTGP